MILPAEIPAQPAPSDTAASLEQQIANCIRRAVENDQWPAKFTPLFGNWSPEIVAETIARYRGVGWDIRDIRIERSSENYIDLLIYLPRRGL